MKETYQSPEIQELALAVEEFCITASVEDYKNPFEEEEQW